MATYSTTAGSKPAVASSRGAKSRGGGGPATPPARWSAATRPTAADAALAAQCGIEPVTAAILRTRGIDQAAAVLAFLDPDSATLLDPFGLPDMAVAVARLHSAVINREPLLIYGDYDVDGVTSTALLVRALRSLGAKVDCRIPERKGEGYGLNVTAIEEAAAAGVRLLITADCGIRDLAPAQRAQQLGLELIITDHHQPGPQLPPALAVINPKRHDSGYGFTELSGCGVAFKLMQALLSAHWPRHSASFFERFVDLAGMAAIADCVPLLGENRILAREGLRRLAVTNKLGLMALMRAARLKLDGSPLRGSHVGFSLAPRLNAAGRLDSAKLSLQLLMSSDTDECEALAQQLEAQNQQRRELQSRIVLEAVIQVGEQLDLNRDLAIVVGSENWHCGVMGLVAGRLAERYNRPALAFHFEDGVATGSGRSAADFDLHELVEGLQPLLLRGGGHRAACGMSLQTANWEALRTAVREHAGSKLSLGDLVPRVEADCEVGGRDLTPQLVADLARLEPCGQGNPEPRLMLRGATLVDGRGLGAASEHLKWNIEHEGRSCEAVWWRPGERGEGFAVGSRIDLCFAPELNHWNGNTRLQLVIKDARPAA